MGGLIGPGTSRVDLDGVLRRISGLPGKRALVALVGPPAAGKSTLATRLAGRLGSAAVVGQDGFHYDDRVLEDRRLRGRKGAPETFDVDGLRVALERLRRGDRPVAVPVFDRAIEIARAGAAVVPAAARVVVVEGNWLALDTAPWDGLAGLFDLSIALDPGDAVLRARLADRWADLTPAARAAQIDGTDMPNARRVRDESRSVDVAL